MLISSTKIASVILGKTPPKAMEWGWAPPSPPYGINPQFCDFSVRKASPSVITTVIDNPQQNRSAFPGCPLYLCCSALWCKALHLRKPDTTVHTPLTSNPSKDSRIAHYSSTLKCIERVANFHFRNNSFNRDVWYLLEMEVLEFELCLYDSCCFHSRPQNILCFGDHGQKLSHFFSLRSFETHMDWHHLQYYIHMKHTKLKFLWPVEWVGSWGRRFCRVHWGNTGRCRSAGTPATWDCICICTCNCICVI